MSVVGQEVHVLEFWGGYSDGHRMRQIEEPPPVIWFRVSLNSMRAARVPVTPEQDPSVLVYDLLAIDDAGVYRYVEHETKARMEEKGWWFA